MTERYDRRRDDAAVARLEERVRAMDDRVSRMYSELNAMDTRTAAGFARVEERLDKLGWVSQAQLEVLLRGYVTQKTLAMWLLGLVGAMFAAVWGGMVAFGGTIIGWLRSP